MRRALLVLLAVAACKRDGSDLCAKAVHHVIELTEVLGPPSSAEQRVIDGIVAATTDKCRDEGLSQAQFDCIMPTHLPDWDDQLRACPAFASKPPSWVIVRPPRDERIRIARLAPTPDGPREGPGRYRQLVGVVGTTCGLTTDGDVQCWGQPLAHGFPPGPFTELAASSQMRCGLDRDGHAKCLVTDADIPDRAPTDVLTTLAVDAYRGCGIRKADQSLVCWNDLDDPPWALPAGSFTQVALTHEGGCALRTDHRLACFGGVHTPDGAYAAIAHGLCGLTTDGALHCWPAFKHARPFAQQLTALSCCRDACCGLTADHQLACNSDLIGPPPAGTFDTVAVLGDHACAVRTGGGTICWGDNDDGACNVPQR